MSGDPTETERLARLEEHVSALQTGQSRIEVALSDLATKFSQRERTNWPVLLTVVGLFLSLVTIFAGIAIPSIGAFLLFTDLRSTNLVAQLRFQEIAPLTASAELSKRDRHELHATLGRVTDTVSEINSRERESTASLRAAMVELETQLRANSQIANSYRDFQYQLLAVLWRDVKGSDMPRAAYYPDISLPKPHTP